MFKPCQENGRIKDCVQWNSVHCWKGFRLQGGGEVLKPRAARSVGLA